MNATYSVGSEGIFQASRTPPDLGVGSLLTEGVSEVETSGGQMPGWLGWVEAWKAWDSRLRESSSCTAARQQLGRTGWWARPVRTVLPSNGAQRHLSRKRLKGPRQGLTAW